MKKAVSFILVSCLILSLSACGGSAPEEPAEEGLTEEQLQRYEEYALGTRGTYAFRAGETINGISVIVPENMDSFLKENAGDISHLELDGAEALVVDYTGPGFRAYVVSAENTVLYYYAESGAESAASAPASAAPYNAPRCQDTKSRKIS